MNINSAGESVWCMNNNGFISFHQIRLIVNKEILNLTTRITTCPICTSKMKSDEEQPYPGLHGYSIVFTCGTELCQGTGCNITLENLEYSWQQRCDEPKKLDLHDILLMKRSMI